MSFRANVVCSNVACATAGLISDRWRRALAEKSDSRVSCRKAVEEPFFGCCRLPRTAAGKEISSTRFFFQRIKWFIHFFCKNKLGIRCLLGAWVEEFETMDSKIPGSNAASWSQAFGIFSPIWISVIILQVFQIALTEKLEIHNKAVLLRDLFTPNWIRIDLLKFKLF